MSTLTVFKSRAQTMGYVFKSGRSVHFMGGKYATAVKAEIEELTTECENHGSNYYIDSNETQVDSELLDPIAVLRAKIREEERAALMIATNPMRDMGTTAQGKLEGISNSMSIRGLAADSIAQAQAAQTPIAQAAVKAK
jgi:hypothetical protein